MAENQLKDLIKDALANNGQWQVLWIYKLNRDYLGLGLDWQLIIVIEVGLHEL